MKHEIVVTYDDETDAIEFAPANGSPIYLTNWVMTPADLEHVKLKGAAPPLPEKDSPVLKLVGSGLTADEIIRLKNADLI